MISHIPASAAIVDVLCHIYFSPMSEQNCFAFYVVDLYLLLSVILRIRKNKAQTINLSATLYPDIQALPVQNRHDLRLHNPHKTDQHSQGPGYVPVAHLRRYGRLVQPLRCAQHAFRGIMAAQLPQEHQPIVHILRVRLVAVVAALVRHRFGPAAPIGPVVEGAHSRVHGLSHGPNLESFYAKLIVLAPVLSQHLANCIKNRLVDSPGHFLMILSAPVPPYLIGPVMQIHRIVDPVPPKNPVDDPRGRSPITLLIVVNRIVPVQVDSFGQCVASLGLVTRWIHDWKVHNPDLLGSQHRVRVQQRRGPQQLIPMYA